MREIVLGGVEGFVFFQVCLKNLICTLSINLLNILFKVIKRGAVILFLFFLFISLRLSFFHQIWNMSRLWDDIFVGFTYYSFLYFFFQVEAAWVVEVTILVTLGGLLLFVVVGPPETEIGRVTFEFPEVVVWQNSGEGLTLPSL